MHALWSQKSNYRPRELVILHRAQLEGTIRPNQCLLLWPRAGCRAPIARMLRSRHFTRCFFGEIPRERFTVRIMLPLHQVGSSLLCPGVSLYGFAACADQRARAKQCDKAVDRREGQRESVGEAGRQHASGGNRQQRPWSGQFRDAHGWTDSGFAAQPGAAVCLRFLCREPVRCDVSELSSLACTRRLARSSALRPRTSRLSPPGFRAMGYRSMQFRRIA